MSGVMAALSKVSRNSQIRATRGKIERLRADCQIPWNFGAPMGDDFLRRRGSPVLPSYRWHTFGPRLDGRFW
jgi:hypothetical protein